MFDVRLGGIELTSLVLFFSIAVLLPAQLLLCFRANGKAICLLSVIILSIAAIVLIAMALVIAGWESLLYTFLAVFAGFMLLMCGLAWGIWALSRLVKAKKGQ